MARIPRKSSPIVGQINGLPVFLASVAGKNSRYPAPCTSVSIAHADRITNTDGWRVRRWISRSTDTRIAPAGPCAIAATTSLLLRSWHRLLPARPSRSSIDHLHRLRPGPFNAHRLAILANTKTPPGGTALHRDSIADVQGMRITQPAP